MNMPSKKIIAFAASTSKTSINQQLVEYASSLASTSLKNLKVEILDLNHFAIPIYHDDLEKAHGAPQKAHDFFNKLQSADGFIISHAEHNGYFTAAYKNLLDWLSRIDRNFFGYGVASQANNKQGKKPTLLMATSPGANGAATVLGHAVTSMPFYGADIVGKLSLPNFYDNFDVESGILINPVYQQQLIELVTNFTQILKQEQQDQHLQQDRKVEALEPAV